MVKSFLQNNGDISIKRVIVFKLINIIFFKTKFQTHVMLIECLLSTTIPLSSFYTLIYPLIKISSIVLFPPINLSKAMYKGSPST